jgi:hypothetical protein
MWRLTYRRSGRASGVVLIEASSLVEARTQASLEAVDGGAEFAEGHELGAALAALVPAEQIGRMLPIEEARGVLEGLRRRVSGVASGTMLALQLRPRLEPVSIGIRTSLCQRRRFLPGNGLARAETGQGFSATAVRSTPQRLGSPASPSPKPRKVKDNSTPSGKPDLRGTAWWGWQVWH